MDLREYLFRKRITQVDFAKKLGVSRSHLSQIIAGTKHPSRKLAKKIEEETNGHVTALEMLFPEEHPQQKFDI